MDNEDDKKYRKKCWITFGIVVFILVTLFIVSQTVWSKHAWIEKSVGLSGCIVSLIGVILALIQVNQANIQISHLKTVEEETNNAVKENRNEIQQFLSFSNIAHLIEVIKHAQTTLREENYKATVIMLQNIKDDLKRVESEWGNVKDTVKIDIHDTIKEIGVDISSLSSFSMIKSDNNQSETLKPLDIHSHLESARDIIVFIETEIRKKKI